MCFSVNNQSSFNNIEAKWINELRHHCSNVPVILVGTKSDLRSVKMNNNSYGRDLIKKESATELAKRIRAVAYVECSAKTRDGILTVMEKAVLAALFQPENTPKKNMCMLL